MKTPTRKTSRQSVQSAETGGEILKALARLGPSATLSRLADAAGMAPAKAHRYLQAMLAGGLAAQDPLTGRYRLGPEAVAIGLAAIGRMDALGTVSQLLPGLRDETGHTSFVAVWGNRGATVVRVAEAIGEVTVVTRVGSVLPLLSSATGLAYAAYLDHAGPEALDPADARALAQASAEMRSALAVRLAEIRRRGLSIVRGTLLPGIDALAAPVFGADGRVAAVVTTLGPSGAFDPGPDGDVARTLRTVAQTASRALGFIAPAVAPDGAPDVAPDAAPDIAPPRRRARKAATSRRPQSANQEGPD